MNNFIIIEHVGAPNDDKKEQLIFFLVIYSSAPAMRTERQAKVPPCHKERASIALVSGP